MPAGYTAAPIPTIDAVLFNHDDTHANEAAGPGLVTESWALPRDVETDFQAVLSASLAFYGITDIPVLKNGVFETASLRKPDPDDPLNVNKGTVVPVIVINLSSDVAERMALGELSFVGESGSPQIKDGSRDGDPSATPPIPDTTAPILQPGQGVALKTQASNVSVDISVYCLNEQLAKDCYLFVKTALFAAEQTFLKLGYIKPPIRTAGSRATGLLETDGGTRFVFEFDLTYQAMHVDFITGIESLGRLIAIRSDVDPVLDPSGQATQIVQLDAP